MTIFGNRRRNVVATKSIPPRRKNTKEMMFCRSVIVATVTEEFICNHRRMKPELFHGAEQMLGRDRRTKTTISTNAPKNVSSETMCITNSVLYERAEETFCFQGRDENFVVRAHRMAIRCHSLQKKLFFFYSPR